MTERLFDAPEDRSPGQTGLGTVSRRTFLAATGIAVAAGASANGDESIKVRSPDEIVLSKRDLQTPADGEYVSAPGATTDSKLVTHLATSVAGFDRGSTAVSGFAATSDAGVPKYVESAVVALPDGVRPGTVALKTDTWLLERYEGTDTIAEVDYEAGVYEEEWCSTTTDGWREVLRVTTVGEGVLVFSVAYGRESAETTPEIAVERYARTMRERAFERA